MTTDSERREVARRLREIRPCKSGHIEWWTIAKALDLKESTGWFGWEKFEPDSVNRLADLIDPSGHECVPGECPLNVCHDNDRIREALVGGQVKVIRESYRAGESWPFFVTLERGEEIRGYFRVDYDALLNLADTLDSTSETDCKGCRLEGAGCAECSSGIAHEAARRIRKALGVE